MTDKQQHLPPLQALDPKEGTNLLQILRKRKPTAADTLTLLLSDLAVRIADSRGVYEWNGIEAASQEEYSRTVQKLNDDQLERHQRNLRAYYFLYESMIQTEKAIMKLPSRYTTLKELYELERANTGEPIATQRSIDVISVDIAETIRAARGLNYFITLLAESTGLLQIKEMLGYNENDLKQQFNDYINADHGGVSVDFNALLNNRYCLLRLLFNDDTRSEIVAVTRNLSGFDNGSMATYSKGVIMRQCFCDDETETEEIKRQVLEEMTPGRKATDDK